MPRKKLVRTKKVHLDQVHNDPLIGHLIKKILLDGKLLRAEKIVYSALDNVAEKAGKKPPEVFAEIVDLCRPRVEVKPRRVGGSTYQVPMEVTKERGEALAIKWIVQFSRKKKGMPMSDRLASELYDVLAGQGLALKKKQDTHRMAEANKAFAHYKW